MACLTPGSAPVLEHEIAACSIKPFRERRALNGKGTERGRSAGCTDDSGPLKPGNSVEDKTPTTGDTKTEEPHGTKNPTLAAVNHTFGSMRKTKSRKTQASGAPTGMREVADERRG